MHHRYVFVGGLHRSGTSLIARLIAELPGVSGITDAPVPENEGVYLQGAIPHDAMSGVPMEFATDPVQHLTESSRFNTLETAQRLEHDWGKWFDPSAYWRVEKSPVNLTRMRLYQQLFPTAQFVIVLRHPECVAAAMAKWTDAPPRDLIDHWLDAHDIVAEDIKRLHSALIIRYEDLVARPEHHRAALAAFLEIESFRNKEPVLIRNGNQDYVCPTPMTPDQTNRAGSWGYGAAKTSVTCFRSGIRHPIRHVRDTVRSAMVGNSN